jgi:hypothetical protein
MIAKIGSDRLCPRGDMLCWRQEVAICYVGDRNYYSLWTGSSDILFCRHKLVIGCVVKHELGNCDN